MLPGALLLRQSVRACPSSNSHFAGAAVVPLLSVVIAADPLLSLGLEMVAEVPPCRAPPLGNLAPALPWTPISWDGLAGAAVLLSMWVLLCTLPLCTLPLSCVVDEGGNAVLLSTWVLLLTLLSCEVLAGGRAVLLSTLAPPGTAPLLGEVLLAAPLLCVWPYCISTELKHAWRSAAGPASHCAFACA